jgi:hypothetical protein
MRPRLLFGLLFVAVLGARLAHVDILWVEECYPAAAAIQILHGKTPYRDFWFDKPPLAPLVYLLWGAAGGWKLRLAGALFVVLVCGLLWRFALEKWGQREAALAAALTAFWLTFGVPSAVMALAPDLLMMAPHALAVYLAWRGQPLAAGAAAGVAALLHTKGLLVFAAALAWQYRSIGRLAAGFALPNLAAVAWLGAAGALSGYVEQVWRWGWLYSRDSFVASPALEGLRRTANWAGFHAAALLGAAWYWWRERDRDSARFGVWAAISLAAVAAGGRFFPRYYFHLLPVVVLAGARGLTLLGRRGVLAACLLVVPLVRFGPRYAVLASELAAGREHRWDDLAMYEGSRQASRLLRQTARDGDTLLVWGYRPDLFVLTRLPAGTPFLDSQPLTGVIADRHLTEARPSAPELARANRLRLAATKPTFVVDGLGPYNGRLAITAYPDLAPWLSQYEQVARLATAVVYRRSR